MISYHSYQTSCELKTAASTNTAGMSDAKETLPLAVVKILTHLG